MDLVFFFDAICRCNFFGKKCFDVMRFRMRLPFLVMNECATTSASIHNEVSKKNLGITLLTKCTFLRFENLYTAANGKTSA